MSALRIAAIAPDERARWQPALRAFERGFVYPLGDDHFHIDHGDDYFAFFDALGDARPFIATVDDRLVGVLVAVAQPHGDRTAWYLCDLKVATDANGARVGSRLLRAWQRACHRPDDVVFGVSMNDRAGDNRLAALALRDDRLGAMEVRRLVLFSLDLDGWRRVAPLLRERLGALSFRDLRGVKDILLHSTGAPMPLLHLQRGAAANGDATDARADGVHMFCLHDDDPLVSRLASRGVLPAATASLIRTAGTDLGRSLPTSSI